MAGQEVSFDEVAAAANGLAGSGLPVTLAALRDTLRTAPLASVQQHLAAWRTTQARPAEVAELRAQLDACRTSARAL